MDQCEEYVQYFAPKKLYKHSDDPTHVLIDGDYYAIQYRQFEQFGARIKLVGIVGLFDARYFSVYSESGLPW